MDHDMLTDITLDHLPDLSEESVSFQIPDNSNTSTDLLLDDFDLLRDDGVSFAPVTPRRPRGPPLTLGELTPSQNTPRPKLPTQQRPASSAKPSHSLALGHVSPGKRRKTPRTKSVRREWESPLVSEERLRQLRMEVDTLGQLGEPPSTVLADTIDAGDKNSVERDSPPRARSRSADAPDVPFLSEDHLDPLPEENDAETPFNQDVAMNPGDEPIDTIDVAVPLRPKSKRNPRTTTKSTVGGITKQTSYSATHVPKKTLCKPPRVREVHQTPSAASQPTPPQSITIDTEEKLAPPACLSGNIDSKPRITQITHPNTGGMAERLVSYSQKLISSIGLYKRTPENYSGEASKHAVRVEDVDIRSQPPPAAQLSSPTRERIDANPSAQIEPLRLSEISPQKSPPKVLRPSSPANSGALQDGKAQCVSPMRPSKKRVTLDADLPQETHARKRGKTKTADTESERGSSDEAVSQAHSRLNQTSHVDQLFSRSETRRSTQRLDSSKPPLPSARTKYRPKLGCPSERKGPTLDPFPYLTRSRQVRETINGRKRKQQGQFKAANIQSVPSQGKLSAGPSQGRGAKAREARPMPSHAREVSGPGLTVDLPLIERKQNATVTVPQLTKPVGFTFRVEARLESRKEHDRLAASAPERMASIDEHAKPLRSSHPVGCQSGYVVPVPFFFSTEQRAKEREKFDEMVRIKEEEMQKLKEEQRRLEVEEEERAIKEMRRRAIPKANEVPEWYADMPKKKATEVRA